MVANRNGRNGADGPKTAAGSETARIASSHLPTTREGKQLVAAALAEALSDDIPDRKALLAIRGVDSLVRTTKFEHTHGDKLPIALVDPVAPTDPLAEEERHLAELEAALALRRADLEKQRAARC